MSLIETYMSVKELIADNLNTVGVSEASSDDGLTTLANMILQASPSKINTVLTLDTPLVVYTDLFSVTGNLEDANGDAVSGATVQLVWNDGSEHIATGVTDTNGDVSFTSSQPASVSSYTFQLVYAGDNDYNASNSSVVTVNTAKETSVLNITNPSTGSVVSTSSVTVTGTLFDNDNTPLEGETVSVVMGIGQEVSDTVDSNGEWSMSVPLNSGLNVITAVYSGSSEYNTSNQSISVTKSNFDDVDIDLSDGSLILSYADEVATPDSQYAEFTAQLTLNDSPASISGVDIEFYKDGVLWDTIASDGNGQATKTYHSLGSGDVEVYAKVGTYLTKTFTVEDCRKYDGASSDKTSNYSNTRIMYDSNTNANYSLSFDSSNSCYKSSITDGNNGSYFLIPLTTLDSDMEISFETYGDGTNVCDSGFGVFNSSNNHSNLVYTRVHSLNDTTLVKRFTKTTSLTSWNHAYNQSESNNQYQKWIKHIISIDGLDFVYTTKDSSDNTIWTYTGSFDSEMSNKQIGLVIGWYKSITSWKNLKIKPL